MIHVVFKLLCAVDMCCSETEEAHWHLGLRFVVAGACTSNVSNVFASYSRLESSGLAANVVNFKQLGSCAVKYSKFG